jgi:hypothetical protein
MNCRRSGCGHSELRHADPSPGSPPEAPRGACSCCGCPGCLFAFGADEDGNVSPPPPTLPPSVEIAVEQPSRDDEPTIDFDTSDVDKEGTKP